jgi:hypothetical protein
MTKGSNHVGSPPRVPTPAKGSDYLHTKGSGQSTPAPKVHREPHKAMVTVKDGDGDGK